MVIALRACAQASGPQQAATSHAPTHIARNPLIRLSAIIPSPPNTLYAGFIPIDRAIMFLGRPNRLFYSRWLYVILSAVVAEHLITSCPRRISLGIGTVILLASGVLAWGQSQLLEGFEDLSRVRVTGGRLAALNAPAVVTQGKQAARMSTGAVVWSSIPQRATEQFQWLRLDTMVLGSIPQLVKLSFSATDFKADLYAYVQPDAMRSGPRGR